MTPPPTRTAASGSRLSGLSPLPALSAVWTSVPLSPLCLCLCPASFLACCVSVSCLRPSVSLGLGLWASPLRFRPEDTLLPFSARSGPAVVTTRSRIPRSTPDLAGRRPQLTVLSAPEAPDPALGGALQTPPSRLARGDSAGSPAPPRRNVPKAGACSRHPAAGSQCACPESAAAETRGSPGWAAGGACSAGAGPRARVRRKACARRCGQLRRSRAASGGGCAAGGRARRVAAVTAAGCAEGGRVGQLWGLRPRRGAKRSRRGSGVRSRAPYSPVPLALPAPDAAPHRARGARPDAGREPTSAPADAHPRAGPAPPASRCPRRPAQGEASVGKSRPCVTASCGHFPSLWGRKSSSGPEIATDGLLTFSCQRPATASLRALPLPQDDSPPPSRLPLRAEP